MPYSFWHLNPLKSSANHPTELLLTLSVLLLMSNAIIVFLCQCVAENEHAGTWTPDPSISRRVCYLYTTGHVQRHTALIPVADIRSCSECWHCLLTHTADMYRYSDEVAVWHADRAPTIILFHRSVMLNWHSTQGYIIYNIASGLQYCFNLPLIRSG